MFVAATRPTLTDRLLDAVDLAIAFVTLEGYGLEDITDRPPRPAPGSPHRDEEPRRRPRTPDAGCPPRPLRAPGVCAAPSRPRTGPLDRRPTTACPPAAPVCR